jgi:cell division protein FtsL
LYEDVSSTAKNLEKQRDQLLKELKKLDEEYKRGKLDEETYKAKRHDIERAIVEVMDRLAQMRFLMGQA